MTDASGAGTPPRPTRPARATLVALAASMGANLIWTLSVFVFKGLGHVSLLEITATRVVLSLLLVGGWIAVTGGWSQVVSALDDKRSRQTLMLSSLFCGGNWLLFVWAVSTGRIIETSFGYFVCPILLVVIGAVAFRERLSRVQIGVFATIVVAVALQSTELRGFPWLSLGVALIWAMYTFVRKRVLVPAVPGFFIECLFLSGPALVFLVVLEWRGGVQLAHGGAWTTLLLVTIGVFTALPLILFSVANNHLRMVTMGIMQYVAPMLQLLVAAFAFGEPMGTLKLLSFVLIWIGLVVYTADAIRRERGQMRPPASA